MDGLVSIRKFLSRHNIKNKFFYYKNFSKLFYSHFLIVCGKCLWNFRLRHCVLQIKKADGKETVAMFFL